MAKSKTKKPKRSQGDTASAASSQSSSIWRVMLLLATLSFVIVGAGAWTLFRPLDQVPGAIAEVKPGEALSAALLRFQSQGLLDVQQRLALSLFARVSGGAKTVRAGEYLLPADLNAFGLLLVLQSGKVILHEVRFIEGWKFEQALDELNRNPDVAHTLPPTDTVAMLRAVGAPETHPEGWFFPDTYRFAKGTSDVVILREAYRAMKKHLAEAWDSRAVDVNYANPEQALIMASLVEKESAVDSERAQIAAVFLHRLKIGMRLQTDPSVIYGLGERYDGNIHSRDLTTDTPYNSYTRDGLPPTPICLPGLSSLMAATHPAQTNALYFVARGNGTHQFSDTLAEHNAAVKRFQLGQNP